MRKFPLAALYRTALVAAVCRPAQEGVLCAPMQGFQFLGFAYLNLPLNKELALVQPLHRRQVARNVRKFPLAALYGASLDAVLCRPVQEGATSAPKQGFHFLAFLT